MSKVQIPSSTKQYRHARFWPNRKAQYRAKRMEKIFGEIDAAPLEQLRNYCRPIWEGYAQRAQEYAQREGEILESKVAYRFRHLAKHAVDSLIKTMIWQPEQEWVPPLSWELLALITYAKEAAAGGGTYLISSTGSFVDYLFDREEARAAITRIDQKLGGQRHSKK